MRRSLIGINDRVLVGIGGDGLWVGVWCRIVWRGQVRVQRKSPAVGGGAEASGEDEYDDKGGAEEQDEAEDGAAAGCADGALPLTVAADIARTRKVVVLLGQLLVVGPESRDAVHDAELDLAREPRSTKEVDQASSSRRPSSKRTVAQA